MQALTVLSYKDGYVTTNDGTYRWYEEDKKLYVETENGEKYPIKAMGRNEYRIVDFIVIDRS